MPLTRDEEFVARLQRNSRVQVPVLIRWKNKLEPGEVLDICVYDPETGEEERFYARLSLDGRFTVPRVVVEELELKPGDTLEITLYA